MLEDEVEGHFDRLVYRPGGSVGKLQGVQKWVVDGFEVEQDFITTEVSGMGL